MTVNAQIIPRKHHLTWILNVINEWSLLYITIELPIIWCKACGYYVLERGHNTGYALCPVICCAFTFLLAIFLLKKDINSNFFLRFCLEKP